MEKVSHALAEGQTRQNIMESFNVSAIEYRSAWESLVWMTHLHPPVPGIDLALSITRMGDLLGFHPRQYAYFVHSTDAFDEHLCEMLSPLHFRDVINLRKLPLTGRKVVCFTTAALHGATPTPVWAYHTLIVQASF